MSQNPRPLVRRGVDPSSPVLFPSTHHHWLQQSLTRRLSSQLPERSQFLIEESALQATCLHSLLKYLKKLISTWHTHDTRIWHNAVFHMNQGTEKKAKTYACEHWWLSLGKKAVVQPNPDQQKTMDAGDLAAHQVPHLPSSRGGRERRLLTGLQKRSSVGLERHKHEHPYYNPSLENRLFWRKTNPNWNCVVSRAIYSLKSIQYAINSSPVCIVLINRHWEDLTSSSFNKSEFIFTTWYCTRSSVETDFFLTDLSLKKS